MLIIKVYRDAPFERASRHTQILQTRQQKIIHHLVFARYRLDKLRVCVDMLNQAVGVLAHAQEICFLLRGLYLPATVRAFAIHKLRFRPEGFARRAV